MNNVEISNDSPSIYNKVLDRV